MRGIHLVGLTLWRGGALLVGGFWAYQLLRLVLTITDTQLETAVAGIRSIVGGEVREYTEMLVEARNERLKRMVDQADRVGADAIVNMRFMTSQVMTGAAELLAYGDAVKIEAG